MTSRVRLAVLLSGGGRTLANLLRKREEENLPTDVVAVAADRPGVGGLAIAEEAGIAARAFARSDFEDRIARDQAMLAWLRSYEPHVFVLAGYLSLLDLSTLDGFPVLNIHPSLLPRHGGKGFYGDKVHAAVLAANERVTGASVHLVNERYDEGAILAQIQVPVLDGDGVAELAARVFAAECVLYPQVLRWIADGTLAFEAGRPRAGERPWELQTVSV